MVVSGIDVERDVMQIGYHPWCLTLPHCFLFFLLLCLVRFVVKEGREVEIGPTACMYKEAFMMAVDKNHDSIIYKILASLGDEFRHHFQQSCKLLALLGGIDDMEVEIYMRQLGNKVFNDNESIELLLFLE
eukprot:7296169-Ditylum_brightwellii.AAC.1